MEYGIGLDIGIASVGSSAVGLDAAGEPCGILRLGSRVFDKAEQPKTGESLATPRRTARGMRRRLGRKALRRQDIYKLLETAKLATREEMRSLFAAGRLEDIYALRSRALDGRVSPQEFARILLHLSQRRGFKSNRKSDAADQEAGRLLSAVAANKELMEQKGYRTAGEMFYKDERYAAHKRNKAEDYLATVGREMVAEETTLLFEAQRGFGMTWATPELEAEYLAILTRQRSFDEGPGGNSPYGGNQIEKMVGRCTLEPDEPRAAKATYSFEYFTLLQKINHIRILQAMESRPLTSAERGALLTLAHRSPEVNFAQIRKTLALPEGTRFNGVRYAHAKTEEEAEKKEKLNCLRAYHQIRKALDAVKKGHITMLSVAQRNAIGTAFSMYKNEEKLTEQLQDAGLERTEIEALLKIPGFSGFGHLSVMACDKIIPYLEQGMNYDAACTAAGYAFRGHDRAEKSFTLPASPAEAPELEDITSPVVRRAVSQTIKVVNALIHEMGCSPSYINIELARELSKDFAERNEMDKSMKENAAQNERLMQELRDTYHLVSPTGQDLVKYRLWREQDGRCAYSLQAIQAEHLFDAGYTDIDHIVPYSQSFDDTRANKVLVLSAENRQKGNRLPLQYLKGARRDAFIVWVNSQYRTNYRKRRNLLKEKLTEEDGGFRQRNLQDTQHMAVFLLNYIRDHLQFSQFPAERRQRVTAVSGAVTAHMRKRWGLTKVRADGDLHHAMDAAVIACTTQGMIQQISRFYGHIESEYEQLTDGSGSVNSKTKQHFPAPWPHFRDELALRLAPVPDAEVLRRLNPLFYTVCDPALVKPVFVSRMPRHKVTGPAHKETIRSAKYLQEGIVTAKQPLTALKLDAEGEIADYFCPSSDTLLYNALKERLAQFGGKADKAFAEPFYKPKSDGSRGPLVRKVKLVKKSTLNVPVREGAGVADNDTMVRIDVFNVPGDGYYWVPIYVADTLKKELPNRAVVHSKPYAEWKEMEEENFLFSLYPGDLIKVTARKENGIKLTVTQKDSTLEPTMLCTSCMLYYVAGNIAVASITVRTHDSAYQQHSLGVKTLKSIRKYQVDPLGNITLIVREPRQTFRK